MKSNDRQSFSIKCECIIMRNNMPINTKKKSKFSVLSLDSEQQQLTVVPFAVSKEEDQPFIFPINKLRSIHKKYIQEGKMTLQFFQKSERITFKGVDVSAKDNVVDIFSSILISSASKENLELMISKIVQIKKNQDSKEKKMKNLSVEASKPKPIQKKRQNMQIQNIPQLSEKINRKDLRSMTLNPLPKVVRQKKLKKTNFDFFDLPISLRSNIFQYCNITLEMRLINKQFSTWVLQNIHSITLRDEVDQTTFNKLAMWAVNLSCRMKNVKSITLKDKYDEPELRINRAKTLKFGQWKEITAKNITQIKGLRIFCLELPFSIKFDLTHLFGQRLVELRFKGAPFSRSEFIKVDDLAHILNNIKDIKALELPFCTSNLFSMIDHPKRLEQLTIYSISDNDPQGDWTNFSKFQNLHLFRCWYIERGGHRKEKQEISLQLPSKLRSLQIGSFLSEEGLLNLPFNLNTLKLVGQFYNYHIQKIILPFLNYLDISESKNIRAQVIDCVKDITLMTSWDKNTVNYMSKFALQKNIKLETTLNSYFPTQFK